MIYRAAILLAALICFIIAAVKTGRPEIKVHWGWVGLAVLVCYVFLTKGGAF